ncbi:hypothetical protein IU501_10905 [Nocardia otitidiscaviarum]|uniref:hypothetical protein n=1 Tax=Nocardia otitidiscaviarum TaxID=1823 RepID=UPI001894F522|nr:hypothetical protein [Nocardia otitidiscaviarum]MBF6133508.1 hypothetical protein [Nocardia otitidiscaviarum]
MTFNVDTGEMHIGGEEFPYFYGDARPTLLEVPGADGSIERVPGVSLTLACADMTVIAPSKVLPDG